MSLKLEVHKKIKCPKTIKKAKSMLKDLELNRLRTRKTHKFNYRVLDMNLNHRLLERTPGVFELLTHETYNKLVDKRRTCTFNTSRAGW